ncbi:hypothetical protein GpartN1_g3978.t1 [Galdieria partita]|uniref:Uncharacterized protein n=1 Tax=Galdieria partita TaxID=83374 RepID=A0A9C7UR63_9RHOD|nr:hypothetical protein GpartN1_g3978.t1 [Galdieria partita]
MGEKEEYGTNRTNLKQLPIEQNVCQGEEKLPSFKSLDSWLHTKEVKNSMESHKDSGNNQAEGEANLVTKIPLENRNDKEQNKRRYDDGLTSEQSSTHMPKEYLSIMTQNNNMLQNETQVTQSLKESKINNTENDSMLWRHDVSSKNNRPDKRQRNSTRDDSCLETSEDVDTEPHKRKQKSLSSSSGSYENSRKEVETFPFDVHEAERYTNSKPHLSAAALQCATLAASELQSELKATEELLNSAARRRRYMYYWYGQSANASLNDNATQIHSQTGLAGEVVKRKPKYENPDMQLNFSPNQVHNDTSSFMSGVRLTDEFPMNSNQSVQNMMQVVSIPETNAASPKDSESCIQATHFTIDVIQEVVKRLAKVEAELREMRSKNVALLRERENLLLKNEGLRKQLEEWKKFRQYPS